MGSSAVCTPGRPVRAWVDLPHPVPLDWALVVGRDVVSFAKGAPGDLGREAVRGGVPPTRCTGRREHLVALPPQRRRPHIGIREVDDVCVIKFIYSAAYRPD